MKINEKNLCMFATSPPVDREGWLLKRGEVNKSWQRRYFVLKGNLLFYFEKKGDREPLGVIILEGCTIELAEDGEQYCFQVVFHGINNRTYFLSAGSQEQMEVWMKALTCAGYEYMKLMVAELQRQLDEIEDTKDATANDVTPRPPPRRQNPFNRPAPPPPNYAVTTSASKAHNHNSSDPKATSPNVVGVGGGGTSTSSSNQLISPASSTAPATIATTAVTSSSSTSISCLANATPSNELSFSTVHEAFGKEIHENLTERKRQREMKEKPLIDF